MTTILFLLFSPLLACEVYFAPIISTEAKYSTSGPQFSNCLELQKNEVRARVKKLSSGRARLALPRLRDQVKESGIEIKGQSTVFLIPNLQNYLNSKIELEDNQKLILEDQDFYQKLNWNSWPKVSCKSCGRGGEQSIRLKSKDSDIWVKARVKYEIKGFKAVKNIQASMKGIGPADVEKKLVLVERPEQYIQSLNELRHKKVISPIRRGSLLKRRQLYARNLTQYGRPVDIEMVKGHLSIMTKGISMSSGRYNENIQVQNLQRNKTFFAKVIGVDKVRVNL